MQEHLCEIFIDGQLHKFPVKGNFSWGEDECLYQSKNNIIANTSWESSGFFVVKNFLKKEQFHSLKNSINATLLKIFDDLDILIDKNKFSLENYHLFIKSEAEHQAVIRKSSRLTIDEFDFDIELLTDNLSQLMNTKLTSWLKGLKRSHVQLRINRPRSLDINPPHRDGYIYEWKDVINMWLPIAGCTLETSLPIVPRSHYLKENEVLRTSIKGAMINNNVYSVPCLLTTSRGNFRMIRPNPQYNEALIFTPF